MTTLAAFSLQDSDFITACYIVAFILFIFGLRLATSPATARRGNMVAGLGMAIAIAATLLDPRIGTAATTWILIVIGLVGGTLIGIPSARMVKMTAMPQMVALFNGVGGGAVALIAWAEFRHGGYESLETFIPILLSMVIGSISFWGSNIAFAKLQELISGKPIMLPFQHIINAVLLLAIVVLCVILAASNNPSELMFVLVLVLAALLGNLVVLPIGGADMPVVISMLNAFTGLAAAAAGFALDNVALIVAGTLVGSSGTILTIQMSEAMNRSVGNVLFAGFGSGPAGGAAGAEATDKTVRSTTAQDAAIQLSYARQVIIVPGYGMAVAQAQHTVRELSDALEKKGVDVKFAIHPVAGRMPGHMNVLLAEADVPYDQLKEMDEINPEFSRTDVSLIIGANDVTNPAAKNSPDSPIYGMPILEVDRSKSVIVLKRSMNPGFAGIENELYYKDQTALLFGDAKQSVADILAEVQEL
jgi:NAD(P) transhydrogenase subunit beta